MLPPLMLIATLWATPTHALPHDEPPRAALLSCLASAGVPVDEPSSTAYALHATAFNLRVPYAPLAVAAPTRLEHIQAAVACGARAGVKVTPKGGGHSYASLGLGGEDGHLVVALDGMNAVELGADGTGTGTGTGTARVQAGARLGHVATELWRKGGRALSHGTCPGVGIGGHVLHGGYGMVSRSHGLALDRLTGATVVLANGSAVTASGGSHADLFWALRGAGSGFGVVADLTFDTFDAADASFTPFAAELGWGAAGAGQVRRGLEAVRRFALGGTREGGMPAEMTMRLVGGPGVSLLEGLWVGDREGLEEALGPLLEEVGGSITKATTGDWMQALESYAYGAEMDVGYPYDEHDNFYAKSLQLADLTPSAVSSLAEYWANASLPSTRHWYFQLDLVGGPSSAVSGVSNEATAYPHRDKLFLMQFYDRVVGNDTIFPSDGFGFLGGFVSAITADMEDGDWGFYANYADSNLDRQQAQERYYAGNLERLRLLKAAYDPDDVFYSPQSIEPAVL